MGLTGATPFWPKEEHVWQIIEAKVRQMYVAIRQKGGNPNEGEWVVLWPENKATLDKILTWPVITWIGE